MLIYWIVWISIIVLAFACQKSELQQAPCLTTSGFQHNKTTRFVFVLAALLLILIAGCRYYVGTDFGGYYRGYWTYLDLVPAIKTLNEPGIRLIYKIAVLIHDNGGTCIIAVAAVTLGLELYTIYKNTDNIGFALALFTFTCWTTCFNGVRQALAAAVLLCGLPFLRDKKFWKYAIIVMLAFLCHRSAIVMILVYFIVNREVNIKNVIILIFASVVVLISYDSVYELVNVVMDNEVTGEEAYWSTQVNILRILTEIAPATLFLYLFRHEEKTPEINFYLNVLIMHAVVGIVTSNSACLARMVMYTMPFAVIAMAKLTKQLSDNLSRIHSFLIIVFFWIMEYYQCSISVDLNNFRLKWFW